VSAERRLAATTGTLLLVLAAAAWIELAGPIGSSMSMGAGAGAGAAPLFLATWIVMTVAMMVPATLPVLLLHRLHASRLGAGPLPTFAFLGGYLLVWFGAGFVALLIQLSVARLAAEIGTVFPAVAGVVLVLAGLYQLTPLKAACLKACRNPLTVLFDSGSDTGLPQQLLGGLRHGVWCLGCCWSLMVVLLLVSFMNLTWMAVVTVVFLLEKNHPQGPALARVAGVLLVLLGLAGLVQPELLAWLSGGIPPTAMGGGM
jgi:predicted metal-binding membrane protein